MGSPGRHESNGRRLRSSSRIRPAKDCPKIIITDNRDVWWIQKCWHEERHPDPLLHQLDVMNKSMLQIGMSLVSPAQKVVQAFEQFSKIVNQDPNVYKE